MEKQNWIKEEIQRRKNDLRTLINNMLNSFIKGSMTFYLTFEQFLDTKDFKEDLTNLFESSSYLDLFIKVRDITNDYNKRFNNLEKELKDFLLKNIISKNDKNKKIEKLIKNVNENYEDLWLQRNELNNQLSSSYGSFAKESYINWLLESDPSKH